MTADTVTAYRGAIDALDVARAEQVEEATSHQRKVAAIDARIADCARIINATERGMDSDQYVTARSIIALQWTRTATDADRNRSRYASSWTPNTGPHREATAEVRRCFQQAIEEIRGGTLGHLRREYYGVKQYEHWASQESGHPYGYGPTHGSVWFRIGLTREFMRRSDPLTEAEIIACVNYLAAVLNDPEVSA